MIIISKFFLILSIILVNMEKRSHLDDLIATYICCGDKYPKEFLTRIK